VFDFQVESNGLFDPFHELIKGTGLGMATWKTGYRGDVVTLFVTFDQNVELLLHCCNIL